MADDIISPLEAPKNENLDIAVPDDDGATEVPGSETVTETAPMDSSVASDSVAPGVSPHEDKPVSAGGSVLASSGDSENEGAVEHGLDDSFHGALIAGDTEEAKSEEAGTVPEEAPVLPEAEDGQSAQGYTSMGELEGTPMSESTGAATDGEGEPAPAAAESATPELAEVHSDAAPIADATDASVMDGFKDAGNALYPVMEKIGAEFEEAVEKLEGEAAARMQNLRDKANHFLAALEAVFARK